MKRLKPSRGKREARLRKGLIVLLAGVIGCSLCQIWIINGRYQREEAIRLQMDQYRPKPDLIETELPSEATPIVNQSVLDAQEMNGDILGWLTLEGTRIDYPFVQAGDNDYYLRRDINEEFAYAGTLFMDYRCTADFSASPVVIYGHNMKNGTMFSDLRRFDSAAFFGENNLGWLYLPDATYRIDPFAYLLVRSDDSNLYAFDLETDMQREQLLAYIRETALRYRELSLTAEDKLLVLSTCAYDFNKARNVVVARLVAMPGSVMPDALHTPSLNTPDS